MKSIKRGFYAPKEGNGNRNLGTDGTFPACALCSQSMRNWGTFRLSPQDRPATICYFAPAIVIPICSRNASCPRWVTRTARVPSIRANHFNSRNRPSNNDPNSPAK